MRSRFSFKYIPRIVPRYTVDNIYTCRESNAPQINYTVSLLALGCQVLQLGNC